MKRKLKKPSKTATSSPLEVIIWVISFGELLPLKTEFLNSNLYIHFQNQLQILSSIPFEADDFDEIGSYSLILLITSSSFHQEDEGGHHDASPNETLMTFLMTNTSLSSITYTLVIKIIRKMKVYDLFFKMES